jgi:pimeloyl-ACP methyl ester carboxylesterase
MTAVFVHGVPETTAVWRPLVAALDHPDVALLALPGFGCALPDGFEPTMERYARWLAEAIEPFDEVDLVTHDWGAILALRVLADRPANVRSWVSDMGDLDPTFEWHDTAKTWQTPGDGEAFMAGMLGASLADRAALLGAVGVPEPGATEMAEGLDQTMADAILALYRSATRVGHDWGPGIDQISAPGLLVESVQDPFRSPHRVARLAERTGAQVVQLPAAGHFWMLEVPEQVAVEIRAFWDSLPATPR